MRSSNSNGGNDKDNNDKSSSKRIFDGLGTQPESKKSKTESMEKIYAAREAEYAEQFKNQSPKQRRHGNHLPPKVLFPVGPEEGSEELGAGPQFHFGAADNSR